MTLTCHSNSVEVAIRFATEAHWGQKRKYTNMPYIVHPIEVATLCADYGGLAGDCDALCAAILHDVVEDTDVSIVTIAFQFGNDVAKLVEELTEVEVPGNRATRKAAEVERLSRVSWRAQTIKTADLISNTRSIVENDLKFAKVYLKEKQALLNAMRKGSSRLWVMAAKQLAEGMTIVSDADSKALGV